MGNCCCLPIQIFPTIIPKRSHISSSHNQRYNNNVEPNTKDNYYSNNIFQSNPNLINTVEPVAQIHRLNAVHFEESEHKNKNFIVKSNELDSRQFSEVLQSENNTRDIEALNTDDELIENIIRHLMKTKIMIDGCTFRESRRGYSITPFVYLD